MDDTSTHDTVKAFLESGDRDLPARECLKKVMKSARGDNSMHRYSGPATTPSRSHYPPLGSLLRTHVAVGMSKDAR